MEDNKLYVIGWGLVASVFCVLILTIGSCSVYEKVLITEAVKVGADPITARCGITGATSNEVGLCIQAATRAHCDGERQ